MEETKAKKRRKKKAEREAKPIESGDEETIEKEETGSLEDEKMCVFFFLGLLGRRGGCIVLADPL